MTWPSRQFSTQGYAQPRIGLPDLHNQIKGSAGRASRDCTLGFSFAWRLPGVDWGHRFSVEQSRHMSRL